MLIPSKFRVAKRLEEIPANCDIETLPPEEIYVETFLVPGHPGLTLSSAQIADIRKMLSKPKTELETRVQAIAEINIPYVLMALLCKSPGSLNHIEETLIRRGIVGEIREIPVIRFISDQPEGISVGDPFGVFMNQFVAGIRKELIRSK